MAQQLMSASWYRVAELRPRLRSHFRIHRHHYRGGRWYVLQDRMSRRTHRFDARAYFVMGESETAQREFEAQVGPTRAARMRSDLLALELPAAL